MPLYDTTWAYASVIGYNNLFTDNYYIQIVTMLPKLFHSLTVTISWLLFCLGNCENMQASSESNKPIGIDAGLGPLLSKNASISHSPSAAPRWSDFAAPMPGTVVNVVTEHDVLVTVRIYLFLFTHSTMARRNELRATAKNYLRLPLGEILY